MMDRFVPPEIDPNDDRRAFLARMAGTAIGVGVLANGEFANSAEPNPNPDNTLIEGRWKYCLNTSTIHGDAVPLLDQIDVASQAGYDSIELWLRDIEKYLSSGGKLEELRKRIRDAGLTIESAIAFAPWIVEDEASRRKAFDQAEKEMDIIVAIGGTRIAAPPAGAVNGDTLDLDRVGDRYRALLEVGSKVGCVPQLEVWGFSKNLSKLSEVLHVAAAAQHPYACVLPDVYHLYKGGSDFEDLGLLAGSRIHVLHVNDYPDIQRDKISDADRVYPGDGIAPLQKIFKTIAMNGFRGVLSLELFNRKYWEMPPLENAKLGLAKMKSAVAAAIIS